MTLFLRVYKEMTREWPHPKLRQLKKLQQKTKMKRKRKTQRFKTMMRRRKLNQKPRKLIPKRELETVLQLTKEVQTLMMRRN